MSYDLCAVDGNLVSVSSNSRADQIPGVFEDWKRDGIVAGRTTIQRSLVDDIPAESSNQRVRWNKTSIRVNKSRGRVVTGH
jgi:hypothetical protein